MSGTMMAGLEARGRAIAVQAAARRRDGIVAAAQDIPGIAAHVENDAVVIEGRRLLARWVEDARLRYLGSMGR